MRATLERLSTLENGSQPQKESPIISEIEDTKSQSSKIATLEKSLQSTKHGNFPFIHFFFFSLFFKNNK